MADTFTNDLRLRLQESGGNSGQWGDLLNTTITNMAEAFSYGTEAIANASTHTITLQDGTSDEARSMYLKCTGGGQACTVTLAPNTISKLWFIENATSYTLTFSQGSGANVAVAAGAVKVIATDGAGSGAAVYDALVDLDLTGTTAIATADINGGTIDNAAIGSSTPAAGSFTTLSTTGNISSTADIVLTKTGTNDAGIKLATAGANRYLASDENGVVAIGTGTTLMGGTKYLSIDSGNATFSGTVTTDVSEGAANSLNTQISMKHQSGSTAYHLKTIRSASSDEPDGLAFVENTSERMRIRGGSVGIGTSSIATNTKLHVKAGTNLNFEVEDSSSTLRLSALNDARSANVPMQFASSSFQFITGSVGIGISSPQAKLHSYTSGTGSIPTGQFNQTSDDNTALTLINANNSATYSAIKLETRETQAAGWMIANEFQSAFNGDLVFRGRDGGSSSAEVLRLKSNGTVAIGIGTNAYGTFSDNIGEVGSGNFCLQIANSAGSALKPLGFRAEDIRFVTGSSEAMRISGGNLFVGGTSLGQNESLGISSTGVLYSSRASGTNQTHVLFYNGSSIVGAISTTASATTYSTSSDQRLKDNITDAEDAGELIDSIQVRQFDWKVDGSHQRFGMVAQELTTVAPEAVSTPEDPDEMMGVDYSKLVPMLIKEIQTLRSRVSELEK